MENASSGVSINHPNCGVVLGFEFSFGVFYDFVFVLHRYCVNAMGVGRR